MPSRLQEKGITMQVYKIRVSQFIIGFVVALVTGSCSPSNAADDPLDWPPSPQPTAKLLGMHIQDDFGAGMTNRLSKMLIPGPQPFCSSLDDPACTSIDERWWILRLLPLCADTNEDDDCVEGLEISEGGETRKSVLLERVQDRTWIADPTRGLPIAGSQGLWSDPFSNDASRKYFVNVFGDLNAKDGKNPPFTLVNFFASITPTSESIYSSGTCIWQINARCGHRVQFASDSRLSLVLHISPRLSGWLGGRLGSPAIKVEPLNKYVNKLTVSGEALSVNVVGASVPYSSASADLLAYMRAIMPGCPPDQCDVGINSSGPYAFTFLEKWKSITKDTASKTIPYWSFSRAPSGYLPQNCMNGGFVGLVTTNATAYQQAMPDFAGDELTYKVSGTHFMSDGATLTKGTYNLLLRSDVARCVYGFSAAPIKASVSIVNESDVQSVATEVVNERDGWMYLAANGFHFSEPSIKIKLTQEAPPVIVPEKVAEATPVIQPKKVTFWCSRGNVKKKVTGAKPVCPKGFKKIADPTIR